MVITFSHIMKYVEIVIDDLSKYLQEDKVGSTEYKDEHGLPSPARSSVDDDLARMREYIEQGRPRETMAILARFPQYKRRLMIAISKTEEGFYVQPLLGFWSAVDIDEMQPYLWRLEQLMPALNDDIGLMVMPDGYTNSDRRIRGGIAYGAVRSNKKVFQPYIQKFINDLDPWVRKQAIGQRGILPVHAAISNLIKSVQETREDFPDEYCRYEFLAGTRKTLREQVFDYFPADSVERSLVTAIINAANRIAAKNLQIEHLDIFAEALKALLAGKVDSKDGKLLEERLLEIDDE